MTAISSAPPAIMARPMPTTSRLCVVQSTSAPAGTWLSTPATVLAVTTAPIIPWVQPFMVRYTARNGPNPVCTSATKKFRMSRPYWLRADGAPAFAAVAAVAAVAGAEAAGWVSSAWSKRRVLFAKAQ